MRWRAGPLEEGRHKRGLIVLHFERKILRQDRQLFRLVSGQPLCIRLEGRIPSEDSRGCRCRLRTQGGLTVHRVRTQGGLTAHHSRWLLLLEVGLGQRAEVLIHAADLVQAVLDQTGTRRRRLFYVRCCVEQEAAATSDRGRLGGTLARCGRRSVGADGTLSRQRRRRNGTVGRRAERIGQGMTFHEGGRGAHRRH